MLRHYVPSFSFPVMARYCHPMGFPNSQFAKVLEDQIDIANTAIAARHLRVHIVHFHNLKIEYMPRSFPQRKDTDFHLDPTFAYICHIQYVYTDLYIELEQMFGSATFGWLCKVRRARISRMAVVGSPSLGCRMTTWPLMQRYRCSWILWIHMGVS